MESKDFMNSKGLGMEAALTVTHRRDSGIHTLKIADMLEEYHQAKLKLLGIGDDVEQSGKLKCHHQYMNAGILQGEAMKKCLKCGDYIKSL